MKTDNCISYGCYYDDEPACLFCGVPKPKDFKVYGKSPIQDIIDMGRAMDFKKSECRTWGGPSITLERLQDIIDENRYKALRKMADEARYGFRE